MTTVIFLRPLLLSLVLIACILTGIALFTPGWRGEMGLVSSNCHNSGERCGPLWQGQPGWYQTVIVLMIMAFIIELVILCWAALAWVGFCPVGLNYPLGALCAVAAVFLIASVSIFAAGNQNEIIGSQARAHLGYSYWIALISAILMALATFVACGVAGILAKV